MSKKRVSVPVIVEHEPRTAGEALMTTTVINRERQERGVKYTEGIEYPDGKPKPGPLIEPYKVQIKRATSELAGLYSFVFNAISYILSHKALHGGLEIMKTGYYDSITMPVDVFLDITLGDTKRVRPFLMSELAKFLKSPQSKAVPYDENYTVYGQPVVVVFGNDKTGNFVKNINRYEIRPDENIQILFMKCFFRDEKGHVQEPKAIYARLIEEQLLYFNSVQAKTVQELPEDGQKSTEMTIKRDPYVQTSAINRVREYLFHHDNGISPKIRYDVVDLFNHTQVRYIRQSGRQKGQIWFPAEAAEFVTKALTVICNLYMTETLGRRPISFNYQWNRDPQLLEVTFEGVTQGETKEKQLFIETKHYGEHILVTPYTPPDKR
jgi:hypothetical protein